MNWKVEASKHLLKQIHKNQIPRFIILKFYEWVQIVEREGLDYAKQIKGYNDEACQGHLFGLRSIRLNRGWRAYYKINQSEVKIIRVERIDKHEY